MKSAHCWRLMTRAAKTEPLFSVIIPTYNRAAFIGIAVQSVLDQTLSGWELIVVDDASTDNTQDVLRGFRDERIRVLRNEKNQERSTSRNRGISEAKGRYVCFLDSDDYFRNHHLETLHAFIGGSDEKVALFATGCVRRFPDRDQSLPLGRRPELSQVEQVIRHHIPCINVAIHHAIFQRERFDPSLRINEDVELFARIAAAFPIHYIQEQTTVWMTHDRNTKASTTDYMTPQLHALRMMFCNPALRPHLSARFRREELSAKYRGRAHMNIEHKRPARALVDIFVAVIQRPRDKGNRSMIGHFLYTCCPGGRYLRRLRDRSQEP